MIKKILYGILALILLILIIAIFVDGKYEYKKSMNINATTSTVWDHISTLKRINKWNPWLLNDPDAEVTLHGTDGKPGAEFCWDSESLGQGCQTITRVMPDTLIETELQFKGLFSGNAKSYLLIRPDGTRVYITWGFESVMPYPFRIMKLFMNMDKMMDKDYTAGLTKLKSLCEPKF